jgi:hypothetical protein
MAVILRVWLYAVDLKVICRRDVCAQGPLRSGEAAARGPRAPPYAPREGPVDWGYPASRFRSPASRF